MRSAVDHGTWVVPPRFNFPRDVIEAIATEDSRQRALVFVDDMGVVRRFTFAEVAVLSAHWANLLHDVGVRMGDRILVLLGKKPEWHGILLGALRMGAICVPCPDMLRAKDLGVSRTGLWRAPRDRGAQSRGGGAGDVGRAAG